MRVPLTAIEAVVTHRFVSPIFGADKDGFLDNLRGPMFRIQAGVEGERVGLYVESGLVCFDGLERRPIELELDPAEAELLQKIVRVGVRRRADLYIHLHSVDITLGRCIRESKGSG